MNSGVYSVFGIELSIHIILTNYNLLIMKKQFINFLKIAAVSLLLIHYHPSFAQQLAFPGAEGFGKYTTGGRGGRVIFVTNTNDAGSGSFREAVTTTGTDPITIVFKVSGIITLESDLRSSRSNMTIAGQTAPGDGICLRKNMVKFSGSNVIIRYIRFRVGDQMQESITGLDTENMKNFIIDHCSFSWSVEENHTCYDNKYSTVQWCILSEGLYDSYNSKGARSYASQWGGQYASYHHNLIAHNVSRSPRVNGCRAHDTVALCDYRNNVIYNWGSSGAIYGGEVQISATNAKCNINWINNYYKPGPATSSSLYFATPSRDASLDVAYAKWYFSGNYMYGISGGMNSDNWEGVNVSKVGSASNIKSSSEFSVYSVITESAANAYTSVLAGAGATLPSRDAVDTRIVNDTKNGTATYGGTYGSGKGIIDSQSTVGGWPTYSSATSPTDSDSDGMPDSWESANGLDLNNANDRNNIGSDGYTMLETYLNSIGTTTAAATLTKHGAGSSSQTVALGSAITSFYYTWTNATSATASGLPSGVSAAVNTSAQTITISGTPTVAGTFPFTVTTVGGSPNVSKGGTITVTSGSSTTLLYQGEDAVINTGVVESTNSGYSGTGYANTDNVKGTYVEWTVNTSVAGSFSIYFRFANGGSTDRLADIYVNGVKTLSSVSFASTGSWTTWANTVTKTVTLVSGTNTIKAVSITDAGCANLDYLSVTGSGTLKSTIAENVDIPNLENHVSLYPNPVGSDINVAGTLKEKSNVTIFVYDQVGHLVLSKNLGMMEEGSFNTSIPVVTINPGMYIMKVQMDMGVETLRFIKK